MSEQEEDKRPEPPVVAVLVPVVITMTAGQAAEYAAWYELETATHEPGGRAGGATEAIADLRERDIGELVLEALAHAADPLWNLATVAVLGGEIVPVGEPFPGRDGYKTGLCGHAVAGSEWAAGFRTCEHCHGMTS